MTRRERNQSRKGTKRALTSSVLAIALCVVLLAGATFAWFTDTASTKISKIEAGTLKVDIVDSKGTSVQGKTLAFVTADKSKTDILWEPGATYKLPEVKVVNKGNLALKYKVVFTAVEGDQSLAEALEIGTIETVQGVETFVSTGNTLADALKPTNPDGTDDTDGFAHGNLAANGVTDLTTFALHMKEAAGNEYQGKSISGLTISVLATQDTVEKDSYGDQYDAGAEYAAIVSSTEELTTALNSNAETVNLTLTSDVTIDVNGYRNLSLGENIKSINIDGGGVYTLTFNQKDSDANKVTTANDVTLVLKNMKITNTGCNNGPWNRHDINFDCKVVLENVISDKAIALYRDSTLSNVTIQDDTTDAVYALWITADGQTVNLDNVTIVNGASTSNRAIAIKDQYRTATAKRVTLNISNSTIASDAKAAILVTSLAGATINAENVNIDNVTADTTNLVWKDNGTGYGENVPVTITGGTCIVEP